MSRLIDPILLKNNIPKQYVSYNTINFKQTFTKLKWANIFLNFVFPIIFILFILFVLKNIFKEKYLFDDKIDNDILDLENN